MREVGLGLRRMHEIGKLHRVLDEEHGDVIAHEIPVALVRIELHGESAHVASGIRGTPLAQHRRKANEDRRLFADLRQQRRSRECRQGGGAFEVAVRRRPSRVHDALGDALMVEMRDLLA